MMILVVWEAIPYGTDLFVFDSEELSVRQSSMIMEANWCWAGTQYEKEENSKKAEALQEFLYSVFGAKHRLNTSQGPIELDMSEIIHNKLYNGFKIVQAGDDQRQEKD
jgi:hypothetical protein